MTGMKMPLSKANIKRLCDKYNIHIYTINSDMTIDVDGNVDFYNKKLEQIPLKFGTVTGDFFIQLNNLTSLDGCPKKVDGNFYCSRNQLASLEGGPSIVTEDYHCNWNDLTSLKGLASTIGGNFRCESNLKLPILEYVQLLKIDIGGSGGFIQTSVFTLDDLFRRYLDSPQANSDKLEVLNQLKKLASEQQ